MSTFGGLLNGLASWATARARSPLVLTDSDIARARSNKTIAILWMKPKDFLWLTTAADDNDWQHMVAYGKVHTLEQYNEWKPGQLPYLTIEMPGGFVVGHEGRHRAAAVMNAGFERFAVGIELRYPKEGARYYTEEPYGGRKTYLGIAEIPRTLRPQEFSSRAARDGTLTLDDDTFTDAVELWRSDEWRTSGQSQCDGLAGLSPKGRITKKQVAYAMKKLARKVKRCGITSEMMHVGMLVEREHRDVTRLGIEKTARIAAEHMCERKDYYQRLARYVEK